MKAYLLTANYPNEGVSFVKEVCDNLTTAVTHRDDACNSPYIRCIEIDQDDFDALAAIFSRKEVSTSQPNL